MEKLVGHGCDIKDVRRAELRPLFPLRRCLAERGREKECGNSRSVAGVRPSPVPAEVSVRTGLVHRVVPGAQQVSSAA
jgi:hypothetical protein